MRDLLAPHLPAIDFLVVAVAEDDDKCVVGWRRLGACLIEADAERWERLARIAQLEVARWRR
jgi:hypothetical protein